MSDPDRIREREHWQAIAEQLGLAPEPEEPSASESRPEHAPARSEGEPAAEQAAPVPEPVERSEEELSPRRGRRGRSARPEEEPGQRREPEQLAIEEPGDKETGAETTQPAEDRSAPKRGRRRRSARTSAATEREAADSASGALASSEEEARDLGAERPKGRSRGRGRQTKTGAVKTTQRTARDEEPGDKVSAPAEEEDTELDDVRSLSNWNVPSWNELIASLYRPER